MAWHNRWTDAQIATLRAEAPSGIGARGIAKMCGRSFVSVYGTAAALGIEIKTSHFWTAAEVETLRARGPVSTARELAKELGRSQNTIRAKAAALGVTLAKAYSSEPKPAPVSRVKTARASVEVRRAVKPARGVAATKAAKRPAVAQRAQARPVASALIKCASCGLWVRNTAEGWAGHKARIGCAQIVRLA